MNHQYSLLLARPEKVAYLEYARLIASMNPTRTGALFGLSCAPSAGGADGGAAYGGCAGKAGGTGGAALETGSVGQGVPDGAGKSGADGKASGGGLRNGSPCVGISGNPESVTIRPSAMQCAAPLATRLSLVSTCSHIKDVELAECTQAGLNIGQGTTIPGRPLKAAWNANG